MKKRFLLPLILVAAVALTLCACTGTANTATLNKTELTLGVGSQETLSLVWEKGEGNEAAEYRWESSDEAIVAAAAEGSSATVTAVAEGSAVVTVYEGEKALASCNVTVVASPLSVTVPEGRLVVRNNATVTVRAKSLTPLAEEYIWESSNTSVATVEYQGEIARVTSVGRGECTITVKNGIYSASFTLIVGLN